MIGQKQKPVTGILTTSAVGKDGGVSNVLSFPYGYLHKKGHKCTERIDITMKTSGIEDKPFTGVLP